MRRKMVAIVAAVCGLGTAAFGQQPYYRGDPNDNRYGQYGNEQYGGDPNNPGYNGDPAYNDPAYDNNNQGVYAPAPPPVPNYAYQTPPAPGPGYFWVDDYWNFIGGRYIRVPGYWDLPPYPGGYWVAPRYSGGRFFGGFWGGGRPSYRGSAGSGYRFQGRPRFESRPPVRSGFDFRGGARNFDRGFTGHSIPSQGFATSPRQNFRSPAQSGFRGSAGGNRGSGNQGHHGGRH
jgi:hypothetical protein